MIDGLHIANPTGDCVTISGHSQNITIQRSEIGPCGGRAIGISNSNDITIVDSYLHAEFTPSSCCDTGDGVFAQNVDTILVQGNVIAFNETNIEFAQVSHAHVVGNFLLNPLGPFPRGQQFQSWGSGSDVNVIGNYTIATDDGSYPYPAHQEDAVNFGFTDGILAQDNYITGGQSNSGCGIIADEAANSATFTGNTLIGTGQCGIAISSGTGQTVTNNKILNTFLPNAGGNTAMYVWNQYPEACGPVDIENSIAFGEKPDGTPSSFWNGGGCDPVTNTSNTWDAAAQTALTPVSTNEPPPQIPPQPYACAAVSPYSNATSAAPCN